MKIDLLPLSQISDALASGAVSPEALLEASLARIRAVDGRLHAFLRLTTDEAGAAAKASAQRRSSRKPLGPLDGVPLALKDIFCMEGVETTCGSRILEGYVPPYDATVVRKLKQAGAVIVGKLNMDEFAMGSSTENSAFGPTMNPWDLSRTPGGSSGGSAAAVAARLVAGAFGTDTGGSIRQPAALVGCVGMKPTYGRVSRFGVIAFASSLDQVGPFAQDVRGVAYLLGAVAGHDNDDQTSSPRPVPDYVVRLKSDGPLPHLGIVRGLFLERADKSVQEMMDQTAVTLSQHGAKLVPEPSGHVPPLPQSGLNQLQRGGRRMRHRAATRADDYVVAIGKRSRPGVEHEHVRHR